MEARLRQEVVIGDQQFEFMPQRSTTDAIFRLRMMMEKWREGQKELHCVFMISRKHMMEYPEKNCGSVCIKLGSQSAMSSPSKTCTKEQEHQWEVWQG